MENENNMETESALEANLRKFDIIFVPTSYVRMMNGTYRDLERTGVEPVHFVDRTIGYIGAAALEVPRLAAYAILLDLIQ